MEKSTVGCALELVGGRRTCHRIGEIRQKLHAENYIDVDAAISGALTQKQLKRFLRQPSPGENIPPAANDEYPYELMRDLDGSGTTMMAARISFAGD